jgi:hypothetical protein
VRRHAGRSSRCFDVVSTEDIEGEDWTLNISRYVLPPVGEDVPPLPEALAAFKSALTEARAAEDRLRRVLVEAMLPPRRHLTDGGTLRRLSRGAPWTGS